MFKFREIKSENEYKLLELKRDTPFTQAWFFGEWQKTMGRKVRRFEIRNNTEIFGFFQTIIYNLVFSNNFIYIPHGPLLRASFVPQNGATKTEQGCVGQDDFLKEFRKKLIEIGKEENAIFVRFDFYLHTSKYGGMEKLDQYFKKVPLYAYHSSYFQPKYEWTLDLNKTENEIINAMHPKNRYNIRLSEKKGVKIEIIKNNFEKYFEEFYGLLKETAGRDNFNLHPKGYYQSVFKTLSSNNAFLAVAHYGNNTLLINLILLYEKTAYFLFGGSSDKLQNLMFSHLAQWETIKEAKKQEMKIYNFGGVQGGGGSYEKYEGISVFKKRFGGEIFEYSDSYDIVLKKFLYYFYNLKKMILGK